MDFYSLLDVSTSIPFIIFLKYVSVCASYVCLLKCFVFTKAIAKRVDVHVHLHMHTHGMCTYALPFKPRL